MEESASPEARVGSRRTDCDWLVAWLEALYRLDDRGRITPSHPSAPHAVPRLHLGRTRHGNVWRIRADVPGSVATRLSRLAAREAPLPGGPPPWPPPERAAALAAALDEQAPVERSWAGPVLRLPSAPAVPTRLEELGRGAERLDASQAGDLGPPGDESLRIFARSFAAAEPVLVSRAPHGPAGVAALACTAAGDTTRCAVAAVETIAASRRLGHGSRVLAAWLAEVVAAGGTPLYAARWADPASLGLGAAVGLEPFADVLCLA